MKKLLKKKPLLFFLLINLIYCCNSVKPKSFQTFEPTKLAYRDSLFLIFTANAWAKVNFDIYNHDLSNSNYATKHPEYKVIRVFYSPDSLKMISCIEIKMENGHGCNIQQGFSFSANSIVGIRDNKNNPWKLYPLDLIGAVCQSTEFQVLNKLEEYFFHNMKFHSDFVTKKYLDDKYGGKVRYDLNKHSSDDGFNFNILKNYGYNIQDKDFWTKSLIWQKGARITGLYNFQTIGNIRPDRKDSELITPKILYPDSILNLYR